MKLIKEQLEKQELNVYKQLLKELNLKHKYYYTNVQILLRINDYALEHTIIKNHLNNYSKEKKKPISNAEYIEKTLQLPVKKSIFNIFKRK